MQISILDLSRKHEGTTETHAIHFDTIDDVDLSRPVDGTVELMVLTPQAFNAHIVAETSIRRVCDKCLREYDFDLSLNFFSRFSDESDAEAELDEDDPWPIDANKIDIVPALREEILLNIPMTSICGPDCPGVFEK